MVLVGKSSRYYERSYYPGLGFAIYPGLLRKKKDELLLTLNVAASAVLCYIIKMKCS